MELAPCIKQQILNAQAKALATYGPVGINVVPVSTVRIEGDQIWLVDYFMDKTKQNILKNKDVSLTFWTGLEGGQIKAVAEYVTSGKNFDTVVEWIRTTLPERTVKGLIVLTPQAVFDVSVPQ